jgi:phospholipid/cholesterol/gamma-HCH transport system substrate-binding protein
MPAAHKVGWAKLRVGLMAVAALIITGILIFLLTGTKKIWAKTAVIYTYMDDSAALATGSPVRLNGILVGEVTEVRLSGEGAPQRIIRVEMEVQRDMLPQIPVDSQAAISAENVLGTKFINIKKGQAQATVQPSGEVRSLDTREFEELVQQGYTMLGSLQVIIKRVDAIVGLVEAGKGSIGRLLVDEELYERLIAIMAEGQKITHAMTTPQGTLGKLLYDDAMYTDVRGSLARFDSLLAGLQSGEGTAGKILKDDALYKDLRATIADVRKITADINAGKGTAGKLLKSEELHDQLRASLGKMDTLLDKINSGQGTIGQLLVNPQLYDSLNGATGEMQQLLREIKANPKKYLRIKLALF